MMDGDPPSPAGIVLQRTPALQALGLDLRLERPQDTDFLCHLFVISNWHELAPFSHWSDLQKTGLLEQQYRAKRHWQSKTYQGAEFLIIEQAGKPIGRLVISRSQHPELRVVDFGLLPDRRGQGFGTALIEAVIAEGDRHGRPVTAQIYGDPDYQRFYQRLGFAPAGIDGAHHLLRRPPTR